MANAGPNTNGSQFFIVTGPNGVALPPLYSLFGQVTKGQDVAEAISNVPRDATDKPNTPVTIDSVTITESGTGK
jgi:cyclophilin family peptidyl-prolyl cis-trans isomerase